jgi:hypothetical protein
MEHLEEGADFGTSFPVGILGGAVAVLDVREVRVTGTALAAMLLLLVTGLITIAGAAIREADWSRARRRRRRD